MAPVLRPRRSAAIKLKEPKRERGELEGIMQARKWNRDLQFEVKWFEDPELTWIEEEDFDTEEAKELLSRFKIENIAKIKQLNQMYPVDAIEDIKLTRDGLLFLTKWEGYFRRSWEPAESFSPECWPSLVKSYLMEWLGERDWDEVTEEWTHPGIPPTMKAIRKEEKGLAHMMAQLEVYFRRNKVTEEYYRKQKLDLQRIWLNLAFQKRCLEREQTESEV